MDHPNTTLPPTTNGVVPKLTMAEASTRVVAQLQLFVEPGQVVELRAIGVKRGNGRPHTEAGFFDSRKLSQLAVAAVQLSPLAKGVYYTLNPLNPVLLSRRFNRVDWAGEGELAKDVDVLCRRWLLIDVDPVRDPHVSATEGEKAVAKDTILAVREFLHSRSWPDPVLCDSGNGFHLLYRIDLPTADGGLVERLLKALASRFDRAQAKIDQTVGNASRICKVPGTLARKGDSTADRPHRRAAVLEVPHP